MCVCVSVCVCVGWWGELSLNEEWVIDVRGGVANSLHLLPNFRLERHVKKMEKDTGKDTVSSTHEL